MIGLEEAARFIAMGEYVPAKRAKELGLVDECFDSSNFFDQVKAYALNASKVNKYERKSATWRNLTMEKNVLGRMVLNYNVKTMLKKDAKHASFTAPLVASQTTIQAFGMDQEKALEYEAQQFGQVVCTLECKHFLHVVLMTKEAMQMDHLMKKNVTLQPLKQVAVIGAGVMGAGISQWLAYKRFRVYLKDVEHKYIQSAMIRITNLFDTMQKSNRVASKEEYLPFIAHGLSYEPLKDAQLVIESAIERLDVKQKIIEQIESNTNENTIIACNTLSTSITDIASASNRKDKIIGMHFFHPVHKMRLVELVCTEHTSEQTVAQAFDWAVAIGKVPIVVKDGPGFLSTRLLAVYVMEAARLAFEGFHTITHIDACLTKFGFTMGPFHVIDDSGLDMGMLCTLV